LGGSAGVCGDLRRLVEAQDRSAVLRGFVERALLI